MKRLFVIIFCFLISINIIDRIFLNDDIYTGFKNLFLNTQYKIIINQDTLNSKYKYHEYSNLFKNTTNFYPSNKNELLDIYYTMMNNGFDNFTYYCNKNYKTCYEDINDISHNTTLFTYMNQLVHPYNSFKMVNSNYSVNGKVDITIDSKYTKNDIIKIDNEINNIINKLNINNVPSINEKIRLFHDYIADTNVYDEDKANNISKYNSDMAIGTLFQGHSTCSGYTDTMAIFLDKLGIENIKIITKKHTWNAIKLDNKWYHLDLTWDDPITNNKTNIILHDYFLITTDQLLNKDKSEHNFDRNLYNFL